MTEASASLAGNLTYSWSVAEVLSHLRTLVSSVPDVRITSSVGPGRWPCLTVGCAPCGTGCGGWKPQRDPSRLRGLVNDRKELGGEGLEVELVA